MLDAVRAAGPGRPSPVEATGGSASAVLAAIYEEAGEPVVVVTRRAQHLRSHRGEVSFPGGRSEAGESLVQTALREANEEVDLDPSAVDVVGELDHLATVTSQSFIVPFVGGLSRPPVLRPSLDEVELIRHVPLRVLLEDGVFREELWDFGGAPRPITFFEIEDETIWGATGSMLRNLLELATGLRRSG